MRLIKIEDGLLEQDNFFTTSPIDDFLGEHIFSRSGNTFTLREGYIERPFSYGEYVIVVEKEPVQLHTNEAFYFYTRKDGQRSGLVEESDSGIEARYWKLIRYEGFIQGYSSRDGENWINKGGGSVSHLDEVQGFKIDGEPELVLKNYRVYRSPYLKIYNCLSGTKAVLVDEFENVIRERVVEPDGSVEIYMNYPLNGKIKIYDDEDQLIIETPTIYLKYGDVFINTEYNLELYYKNVLLDYKPTTLYTRKELVVLKNTSLSETYYDVKITVVNDTVDTVTISFDDVDFYDNLILPQIVPDEEVDIYIKIEKNNNHPSYGVRRLALEID